MSYLALALILNFVFGFIGYAFLVKVNAPADNAYRVVWGSAAFWVVVAVLASVTTGWSSAGAGLTGGFISFVLLSPGDVFFTWGRAIIRFANTQTIRRLTPVNAVLRFVGVRLQDAQVPFNSGLKRR
jgi:hypothetical protein